MTTTETLEQDQRTQRTSEESQWPEEEFEPTIIRGRE
jgi:hypothetical protein